MTDFTFATFAAKNENDVDIFNLNRIVIAPGRFNPPHRGHKFMFERLKETARELKATPVVIIVDTGKICERNPLDGETRELYIKEMFPGVKTIIAKNPYDAVVSLHEDGMLPVGGVCGADRASSYKGMIGRIFGDVVMEQYHDEVLHRDPDSDDIAGISASLLRESVKQGNIAKFRTMVDLDRMHANDLFDMIKKGMEIEDGD
jgi:cytidyltransferase-like protein